jgi:hypothetical protein
MLNFIKLKILTHFIELSFVFLYLLFERREFVNINFLLFIQNCFNLLLIHFIMGNLELNFCFLFVIDY